MTKSKPIVRYMIQADLPQVCQIETIVYRDPWTHADFTESLKARTVIGLVADCPEVQNLVIGYLLYEIRKRHLHILNLTVTTDFQRKGTGTAILTKLKSKLTDKSDAITVHIDRDNVDANDFLRANGFRAAKLIDHAKAFTFRYTAKCE